MKKVLFTISLTLNLLCLIGVILFATKRQNLSDEINLPDDVIWEESITLTEGNLDQTYIQLADNLLMLKECSKTELRSKIETRCNAKGFTLKDIDFSYDRYPSKTYEEEILKNPPANLTSNEYKNYLETVIHRYGLRYMNGNIELNIEVYDGWENKGKERVSKISLRNIKISSFDELRKKKNCCCIYREGNGLFRSNEYGIILKDSVKVRNCRFLNLRKSCSNPPLKVGDVKLVSTGDFFGNST